MAQPRRRSVLITGSASGFGRGLVTALLKKDFDVIATLRAADRRRGLFAAELDRHPTLELLPLDVADPEQRRAAAEHIAATRGGLDVLINNAGYGLLGALEDVGEAQLRSQMEVNFFGLAGMIRDFLPLLRRAKGRIINVSSVLGYAGFPLSSAYCASKFAVEGLSEALYHELRPHGVQVALVEPGGFRTKFAENCVWGERSEREDSPYRVQTDNFRRMRTRRLGRPGAPPSKVVAAIVRLASVDCMPLRTRVGLDAAGMNLLKRVLPRNAGDSLMAKLYGRIFLKSLAN